MEFIAGEWTLDTFNMLYGVSGYYKVDIVISANGKVIPVESVVMNVMMSADGVRLPYTSCLSVKENKKDCAHVFTQDIETSGPFDVKLTLYIPASPLLIKNGVIATVSTGYKYAGYIRRIKGISALREISKTKQCIDFDISEKFNTVIIYKGDNCIDCLIWIKFKNIPMPQKYHVFETELPPVDYGDIIRLNEAGDYGTLDSYMLVGTVQYKWADGLYVKVAGIDVIPIYVCYSDT